MATIDFNQWIQNKNGNVKDLLNGRSSSSADGQIVRITFLKSEINVIESSVESKKEVKTIDNVLLYPIDSNVQSNVNRWREDDQLRASVLKELSDYLRNDSSLSQIWNTIQWKGGDDGGDGNDGSVSALQLPNILSLSLLNKQLLKYPQLCDAELIALPEARHSILIYFANKSLLSLANRVVPYLLSASPVTIVSTDADSSVIASYLIDTLASFGVPVGLLNHLIDLSQTTNLHSGSFVLLETGDVDSSLENAVNCHLAAGIDSIKIFAQEQLQLKLEQILKHKLKYRYSTPQGKSIDLKINLDSVDFEHNTAGIEVYYFRTSNEVLKMLNHLMEPTMRPRFVSIWGENSALAYKLAGQIQSTKQIFINTSPSAVGFHPHRSQFELIAESPLSELRANNNSLLNGVLFDQSNSRSWRLLNAKHRLQIVSRLLKSDILAPFRSTVMAGQFGSINEVSEDFSTNLLEINRFEPMGIILIKLDESKNNTPSLVSFCLNALILGNCLALVGTSSQIALWKQIKESLNNQHASSALIQIVESTAPLDADKTSQGALRLVDEQQNVQSMLIEQAKLDESYYSSCFLKRLNQTISTSLPEFEMTKIVE